MVELKLSQGAKPGHGGVLPAPKVSREISPTRGVPIGPGLHLAVAPFGLLDADRDDAVHRRDCAGCRAASRPASSSASATHGNSWRSARRCWRPASIPTSSSSTARKAAPARRRWSSSTISARRCARACYFVHNALVGIGAARPHQARRRRQDHHRLRHRARHGAGRRLVQRRARLHVRARLHPVADLPHRPLPDRRRHPGPDAPARAGRARQDRSAWPTSTAPPCTSWPS